MTRLAECLEVLAAACRPVVTEIRDKTANIFHYSYAEDHHVEVTLTIAECRAVVRALRRARRELKGA